MRFRMALSTIQKHSQVLVYRPEEFSFDVEPVQSGGFTSILINDLNLEVDAVGRIISVWGLCPHTRWIEANVSPPDAAFQDVFVSNVQLFQGISLQLDHALCSPVYVDPLSGWIRIQSQVPGAHSATLLPGVIFEMSDQGQFSSLWLLPRRPSKASNASL